MSIIIIFRMALMTRYIISHSSKVSKYFQSKNLILADDVGCETKLKQTIGNNRFVLCNWNL